MQTHITLMQARLDALKALEAAAETLCQTLTPEQTKKADTRLGMSGMRYRHVLSPWEGACAWL
jgi:hypothetical protein